MKSRSLILLIKAIYNNKYYNKDQNYAHDYGKYNSYNKFKIFTIFHSNYNISFN